MTRIDLYEDNAGGLWLVPEGEGIAIEMPRDGDFLTDARPYRDSWGPEEYAESVYPVEGADLAVQIPWSQQPDPLSLDAMDLVATYRTEGDALEIHESSLGLAGREYLRASLRELRFWRGGGTMIYRAISLRKAQWIGNAATVLGGYVAVDGPRVERITSEEHRDLLDDADEGLYASAEDVRGWHRLAGSGDYVRAVTDPSHQGRDTLLIMRVPADHPLGTEGFGLPNTILGDLRAALEAAGYAEATETTATEGA